MTDLDHPAITPAGLLDDVLAGRVRGVQVRVTEALTRGEVADLAWAIDRAVMWSVRSFAERVSAKVDRTCSGTLAAREVRVFIEQATAQLQELVDARAEAVRRG